MCIRDSRRMLDQEDNLCVVGEASNGESAIQMLRVIPADVVLLDARLSGIDGIETLRRLKSEKSGPKVIMLTSYGDEFIGPAVDAGADGFLLKRRREFSPPFLICLIHCVVI